MELIGRAQGKLLLLGEHAVVYGHPALGMTLPLTTQVRLRIQEGVAPDHEIQAMVTRLVSYMAPAVQDLWQRHPWQVEITSDVPIACGLGSSAALCGALARALAQGISPDPDEDEICRWAHQAERYFHGRPSGVDTALSLERGLSVFDPQSQMLQPCSSDPFGLIVGSVMRQSNTRTLVQQVHDAYHDPQGQSRYWIDFLGEITRQVIDGIAEGQSPQWLGQQMNRAHRALQTLGLSTPLLDQLLEWGLQAGGCGGKLSGAGGGGAFVLVCAKVAEVTMILQRLQQRAGDHLLLLRGYYWDGQGLVSV